MTDAPPTSQSMLAALRSDHAAITARLADPANAAHTDGALIDREQFVTDLVRHFVAEEQYLYPTIREHLEDGPVVAAAGFAADRGIEGQLKELEEQSLTADRLAARWQAIGTAFAEHVARQEPLFAKLAATCSAEQLAELGDGIAGAEQLAPTRPRRVAPESASTNKIASFVEGYVDQVRDYYSKRGAEPLDR